MPLQEPHSLRIAYAPLLQLAALSDYTTADANLIKFTANSCTRWDSIIARAFTLQVNRVAADGTPVPFFRFEFLLDTFSFHQPQELLVVLYIRHFELLLLRGLVSIHVVDDESAALHYYFFLLRRSALHY